MLYSNEKNPIHTFNSPEVYNVSLNAINQFGCSSLAYQTIQINPEYTFFIPDAFSPDGDGLNDTFQPKGDRISSFNMKVFDRWGGILFESSDINYGWDGTNNEGLKSPMNQPPLKSDMSCDVIVPFVIRYLHSMFHNNIIYILSTLFIRCNHIL